MQAPKPKARFLEVTQRKSSNAPQTNRQLKRQGSYSESVSISPHSAHRTPKETSLKAGDNKSSLSPASEKRRPSKVSDYESQIAQLKEELKKAKEQLNSSESFKSQAQQGIEEAKRQISSMSSELNESRQHLYELSASEDERIRELRKISQDRDRAWQSELEAVHRQHSMDSSALASAINEIKKLKNQLEKASHSKQVESAHIENQRLRMELEEVENLRAELSDLRVSEAQTMEVVRKTQMQLEIANGTIETNRLKAMEAINSLSFELKQSKDQVKSLEGLVRKFLDKNSEVDFPETNLPEKYQENEKINRLQAELNSVRSEASLLRSSLDAAESKYQEEYYAYEQIDFTKAEGSQKQAELEAELDKAKAQIVEFMDKGRTKAAMSNQLDAAQAANIEMESDLRRMKVQLDQWRKAAELAASMLSDDNDGKMERASSFDIHYSPDSPSPNTNDLDDDSKKKNATMLKKIGVLWKKGQK